MSVLNENQLVGASAAGGDYEIEQSLKINESRGFLSWTPYAAGNRRTWTWSGWVKRATITDGSKTLFAGFNAGTNAGYLDLGFTGADKIGMGIWNTTFRVTDQVFRDTGAWYHIIAAMDTTQSTAANRLKVYVNGDEITSWATNNAPDLNFEGAINDNKSHWLGSLSATQAHTDGYLAEVNFIDGQALTPDNFGETGIYGQWKPIEYAGTYGNNGFYLPFKQDYTVEGFSTVLYEGHGTDGSSQYVGGVGFSPDMTWLKTRIGGYNPVIFDSLRGSSAGYLQTDSTDDETAVHGFLTPKTDGFEVIRGTDAGALFVAKDDTDYVAWNWDMGGTTVSNTNGSITSSVRANVAYGQSIIKYTGNNTSGATVGHGLSAAPEFVFTKADENGYDWPVYHSGLASTSHTLTLNLTSLSGVETNKYNGTAPSSTVVTLGNHGTNRPAGQMMYAFHSVAGYSKFGAYSGSGSSGKVVTTGFAPAFVLIKRTDAANIWAIYDNTRNPFNPVDKFITNSSVAENNTGGQNLNFTSTGFTVESNGNSVNATGGTYIYAAFADTREYAFWYDQSGNNNDWASNDLTESDVMVDSPTNNFCTLNPLDEGGTNTVAEGNLQYTKSGSNFGPMRGTLGVTTGKWYFEAMRSSNSNTCQVGVSNNYNISQNGGDNTMGNAGGIGAAWDSRGYYYRTGGSDGGKNTFATNEIVSVAFDADTGKIWWRKSGGSWQDSGNPETGANPSFTASGYSELMPFVNGEAGGGLVANFGADSSFAENKTPQGNADSNAIGDFYYAPPTGFLALCTKNMEEPAVIPSEHFNTLIYTGTDADNRTITGVGFQPDFAWFKRRNSATNHGLYDSLRNASNGLPSRLSTNLNAAEAQDNNALQSFNSDGYVVSSDGTTNAAGTYVSWNWKAGGTAVSNTNGSITSQVSANPAAGFSIVSWTHGSGSQSIGHGLSQKPDMIIVKGRSNVSSWWTWHKGLSSETQSFIHVNTTSAAGANVNAWNNQAPTASVFYQKEYILSNNDTGIAYCFHSVDGHSKVGSFIGNGSETAGPFVHCGFKPAFLLFRRSTETGSWFMFDNARGTTYNVSGTNFDNVRDNKLNAEANYAEDADSSWNIDFLSNGFKLRSPHVYMNGNNLTHIFIAFAENPFKHSTAH